MQLGKRPKKNKGGRLRSPSHLAFVRKHKCLVDGCMAENIQTHHISNTATAAMGAKSGDEWVVPLCLIHHDELHTVFGPVSFQDNYNLDLREAALWLARRSPDEKIRKAGKGDE